MSTIELSNAEVMIAVQIGGMRRAHCLEKKIPDKRGIKDGMVWNTDVEGAAAEMAYCKFRNLYWPATMNNFKGADVGSNVQIRSTHWPNGRLKVNADDNPEDYYVLVIGKVPTFRIIGWMKGKDAMNAKWWGTPNDREPAFWVPQEELNHFK